DTHVAAQEVVWETYSNGSRTLLRLASKARGTGTSFAASGGHLWNLEVMGNATLHPVDGLRLWCTGAGQREIGLSGRPETGEYGRFAISPDAKLALLQWTPSIRNPGEGISFTQTRTELELWDLSSRHRVSVWNDVGLSLGWTPTFTFSPDS